MLFTMFKKLLNDNDNQENNLQIQNNLTNPSNSSESEVKTVYICQKPLMINPDLAKYNISYFKTVANVLSNNINATFTSKDAAMNYIFGRGTMVVYEVNISKKSIYSIQENIVKLDKSKMINDYKYINGFYLPNLITIYFSLKQQSLLFIYSWISGCFFCKPYLNVSMLNLFYLNVH